MFQYSTIGLENIPVATVTKTCTDYKKKTINVHVKYIAFYFQILVIPYKTKFLCH